MHVLLQDYRYYDIYSVIFKITDRCNLGCAYCYRENATNNNSLNHMPLEVIDSTLDSLFQYKKWLYAKYGWVKQPALVFVWHGGEPLAITSKRIDQILEIQNKYKQNGFAISNSIQTNGTLIKENRFEILNNNNFQIGISLDGPQCLNKDRVYKNGRESIFETLRGIKLLNEKNYPWSAIAVITEDSVGKEQLIFDFFREQKPVQVDFIPSFFYESSISLAPDSYTSFMTSMFDIWMQNNKPFEIRFLKDILYKLGLISGQKNSICCELAGSCHRNISILTNGDVYPCECLNPITSNKIGNINDQTFLEIAHSGLFNKLAINTNTYHRECDNCDVFDVCKAGCYNRRLPNNGREPILDYYCTSRKAIIHHIMDHFEN